MKAGSIKIIYCLLTLNYLFTGCQRSDEPGKVTSEALQKIVKDAKLKGAILIFDESADTYYCNNYKWAKTGQLPASTFKIPN